VQNTRYSCWILMTLEFSRQTFDNYSDIKCHKNPSIGSRLVPRGLRTDTTKLMVAFRNFSTAPKREHDVTDNVFFCVLGWKSSEAFSELGPTENVTLITRIIYLSHNLLHKMARRRGKNPVFTMLGLFFKHNTTVKFQKARNPECQNCWERSLIWT
jgi:hypothetical protein